MKRELILNRRRLLGLGAASAATLTLSGCDWYDGGLQMGGDIRSKLEQANNLTYRVQRLLLGQQALAPTYSASEIRQAARPNGSTDPQGDDYLALKANDFADYKLKVTGLVDKELNLSLAELRNMPAQSQITRHDCVEGWSYIAKWSGTRLGPILDAAGIKPRLHGRRGEARRSDHAGDQELPLPFRAILHACRPLQRGAGDDDVFRRIRAGLDQGHGDAGGLEAAIRAGPGVLFVARTPGEGIRRAGNGDDPAARHQLGGAGVGCRLKMDSRFRGNDEVELGAILPQPRRHSRESGNPPSIPPPSQVT